MKIMSLSKTFDSFWKFLCEILFFCIGSQGSWPLARSRERGSWLDHRKDQLQMFSWPKSSAPCIPVFDPSQKVKVEMNQMERSWWGWKQLWYTAGQRWGWLQPTLGSKSCKWWKRSIELNALSCETDISSLFLKSRCLHETSEDLSALWKSFS